MALLPARMQNSDPFPLRLGKKIVAEVAVRPDPFREFEKGDGARLLDESQRLSELMNGARGLMFPYSEAIFRGRGVVQIAGRGAHPAPEGRVPSSWWVPSERVEHHAFAFKASTVAGTRSDPAPTVTPLTKEEIRDYFVSRIGGRRDSMPEEVFAARAAARFALPANERP